MLLDIDTFNSFLLEVPRNIPPSLGESGLLKTYTATQIYVPLFRVDGITYLSSPAYVDSLIVVS